MTKLRITAFAGLAILAGCAGDTGDGAGPIALGAGGSGAAGESGWGAAGSAGASEGFAGSAGSAGEGFAGSAGSAGEGFEGFAGSAGSGGEAGSGGPGGTGGIGTGGSGGGLQNPGSGGTGGTSSPFKTAVTGAKFEVLCAGGPGMLGGYFTAFYENGYPVNASASVKQTKVAVKNGTEQGTWKFGVKPSTVGPLAPLGSTSVKHDIVFNSGTGSVNLCWFCGGSMTLDVEWLTSLGITQTQSYGPMTIKCITP
jgi:hypothetical protein